MKIRKGFVSNSSTSSFIIKVGSPFNSTVEAAKYMLENMKEDREDKYKEAIDKRIENLKNITDPNSPICFHSCNYETYIRKIDESIFIFTCNNETWGNDIYNHAGISQKALDIIIEAGKHKKDFDKNYVLQDIQHADFYSWYNLFDDYYSLDINAIGKWSNTSCKKCDNEKFRVLGSNKDICPYCNPELFDESLKELKEKEHQRKYEKLYMIIYKKEPIGTSDKLINELLKTIEGGL